MLFFQRFNLTTVVAPVLITGESLYLFYLGEQLLVLGIFFSFFFFSCPRNVARVKGAQSDFHPSHGVQVSYARLLTFACPYKQTLSRYLIVTTARPLTINTLARVFANYSRRGSVLGRDTLSRTHVSGMKLYAVRIFRNPYSFELHATVSIRSRVSTKGDTRAELRSSPPSFYFNFRESVCWIYKHVSYVIIVPYSIPRWPLIERGTRVDRSVPLGNEQTGHSDPADPADPA